MSKPSELIDWPSALAAVGLGFAFAYSFEGGRTTFAVLAIASFLASIATRWARAKLASRQKPILGSDNAD